MDLNVLVLDDELPSLRDPLQQALKPFLVETQIPALSGGPASVELTGLIDERVQLIITCNNSPTFRQVKKELEGDALGSEFDLVLLDDQWGGGEGEFAGQEVLLAPVFNKIRSNGGGAPIIALWTQEWEQETRTNKFTRLLTTPPYWGTNRVRGLSKTNTPGLRLLLQDAVASRQLKNESESFRRQRDLAALVAHSDLELLSHTRNLIGIDKVLVSVAETLQPYFRWLNKPTKANSGVFASKRRSGPFVAALLFEGEPASGKSALCKAIAEAFRSKAQPLDKSLGPGKYSQDWKKKLEDTLKSLYLQAANDRTVVVIRADDLMWPALVGDDSAMAADWREYMLVVREFIRDASLINAEKVPSHTGCLPRTTYQGKILWVFARNTEIDAGEMFGPLQSFTLPFEMKFPTSPEDRKQILKLYAERQNYSFATEALEIATSSLIEYSARDLIGDEEAPRGFLLFATQRVDQREEERWTVHQDETLIDSTITEAIVRDWLNDPRHEAILMRVRRRTIRTAEASALAFRENTSLPPLEGSLQQTGQVTTAISKAQITAYGERQLLIQIDKAISEKISKDQIAKEYLQAKRNGRQAFINHFKTKAPGQVLRETSEEEAKRTFRHILEFLSRNPAIHRDHPELYPDYVKTYRS